MNITCKSCGQNIEADSSFSGTVANCPTCNSEIRIPLVPTEKKMTKINRMLYWLPLGLSLIAIALHFNIFTRTSLNFETPEDAIKTLAKLEQNGSFEDLMRAQRLFKEDSDWKSVSPGKIEIQKTLEVKNTGDDSDDGGVLCFLQFKKDDGVESHKVVFLKKNKNGLFNTSYLDSAIEREYGTLIKDWEKDGSLK